MNENVCNDPLKSTKEAAGFMSLKKEFHMKKSCLQYSPDRFQFKVASDANLKTQANSN